MVRIKDFKGIRPQKKFAQKVAALPYDVYSLQEARDVVMDNPLSFLRVDRAEVDLAEDVDPYSQEVYEKAAENLNTLIADEILSKDKVNSLYIYQLTMKARKQTGLVCLSSIDDYLNGTIKTHELTRHDKEEDRIKHVDVCDMHTGAIFLTYLSNEIINHTISSWMKENEKEYDFFTDDAIRHEVWAIHEPQVIEQLKAMFSQIDNTYIADGHHRSQAAVKVGLKRREADVNYTGEEEFNYFLSVLFPHDELTIMDYNRVVKDLNGLTKNQFIEKLKNIFTIDKWVGPYKPCKKGTFGMYLDNDWYKLEAKKEIISSDILKNLDVAILQDHVLEPILGIVDIRKDNRIDFVGGIRGLDELEKRCQNDMRLAFAMYPTSIEELIKISDENRLMPPKSTWFEPKLRSGLFLHKLT